MLQAAIALFFIVATSSLAFPAKEVWEAAAYNIGISSSLLGGNSCGFGAKGPTEGDPFSNAGVRIVTIEPLVDNVTSDLSSPSLVWSWAAEAPASATFLLPGTTECPGGEIELFNRSRISLTDARLEYVYGGKKKQLILEEDGPNPVALELNSSELSESDFMGLYANLSAKLSARASVSYSFRKRELYQKCDYFENATVCYCAEKFTLGKRNYEEALSDGRNFLVEVGPVQEFWLNPPLQQRLDGKGSGKVILFARRVPGKISAGSGKVLLGSVTPYRFELQNGSCGEKIVKSAYAPVEEGLRINRGNWTVAPSQLVDKNASYLPVYIEFDWAESAGKREVVLEYEDWFSHAENFTRGFSVRKPEPFVSNSTEGALAIRTGDDRLSPAAYPIQEKAGALPDISPIAALLAIPLAFGAIGLLRWMRKIVP